MSENMQWALLAEVQGRLEAEFLKSYLEAQSIAVTIFQEAVGHHVYPVTVNGLGRVQLFVPAEKEAEARQLLEEYQREND